MITIMDPLSWDFSKKDAPNKENEVRASPVMIVKPTGMPILASK